MSRNSVIGLTGRTLLLGASLCALQAIPALAPSASAQTAQSQASDDQGIGEVVVTAQRREEQLIDVPIAITAIGAEEIQNITAGYMTDVGIKAPNVIMDQSSISPRIAIRGVTSQSSINAGFPPAIGVYVDEVYQGRDPTFNTILSDVARLEILRGPQGTLYGKNTIGGAINIITQAPTEDFQASGDVTFGNYGLIQGRASLSGALVPNQVRARLSLAHRERDGYLNNTTTGQDLNDISATGGRLVIDADLAPNLRARFSADAFSEDGTSALETGPAVINGTVVALAGIPTQVADDNVVQLDGAEFAERALEGYSARFDWDFQGFTLTSITAYRDYTSNFGDDSDGLPINAFNVGREENGENFSQEFRLTSTTDGPLSWILGAYFYNENTENIRRIQLGPIFPYLLAGNNAAIFYPTYAGEAGRTESTIEGQSWALFGSLSYDLSADLHLGAGLRYTDEQKDFSYIQYYTQTYTAGPGPSVIPNFAVNIPRRNESYSDGQFTGDLSLSYDITDDQVIFARYSHGYKAGGFQTDVISPPFDPLAQFGFDPETVDNYEIGYKSFWFGRRLELNLAAFHMDWQDKQEQVFTGLSFIIDNAASATSDGVELEFTARPAPGLTLDGNFAYLDAHYEEFAGSPGAIGRPIPNQPEYSGSLGAQYVTPVYEGVELFSRADVIYRDESFVNVTNALTNPAVTTLNARVGLQSADNGWGIYLWGRNITDEITISQGQTFPFPFAQITTRAPGFGRTYGVELRASF
ncbi:TonB-dependent receptor [Terricaulis sp.]|uniref:TonB-dependent receptor n=1 Tax=Terricaulis sp. TaxID=2768686 RepID=UPI00378380E9